MSLFGGLSFGSPWILAGLIILPAIWWLLRVTPPAARRVPFPPLRLLRGLTGTEETPARTPWWLVLLRMIVAALVIFALAEPILGETAKPLGSGPLVLFVDNGWTAAHAWADREAAISDALTSAARAGRAVTVVPTASANAPRVSLLDAGAALRAARDLSAEPWPPNRARAIAALAKTHFSSAPQILWLSDSLDYEDGATTAQALSRIGHLTVLADPLGKMPLALLRENHQADGFKVTIIRAGTAGERKGNVLALGAGGEVLATAPF